MVTAVRFNAVPCSQQCEKTSTNIWRKQCPFWTLRLLKCPCKGRLTLAAQSVFQASAASAIPWELFIYLFFNKFIYLFLFLAVLGLRCCTWAFSSCGERELVFVAVCGLLIVVASLVAEHGL